MRFLVDECAGPTVAKWLQEKGHDILSIYETNRGINDEKLLQKAYEEKRVLITTDKGFGEKIYRENYLHCGVILMRLEDERSQNKIKVLEVFLKKFGKTFKEDFVVLTDTRIRFAKKTLS